jgi:hypothetical protein
MGEPLFLNFRNSHMNFVNLIEKTEEKTVAQGQEEEEAEDEEDEEDEHVLERCSQAKKMLRGDFGKGEYAWCRNLMVMVDVVWLIGTKRGCGSVMKYGS